MCRSPTWSARTFRSTRPTTLLTLDIVIPLLFAARLASVPPSMKSPTSLTFFTGRVCRRPSNSQKAPVPFSCPPSSNRRRTAPPSAITFRLRTTRPIASGLRARMSMATFSLSPSWPIRSTVTGPCSRARMSRPSTSNRWRDGTRSPRYLFFISFSGFLQGNSTPSSPSSKAPFDFREF